MARGRRSVGMGHKRTSGGIGHHGSVGPNLGSISKRSPRGSSR